jgi:hypothetical protein
MSTMPLPSKLNERLRLDLPAELVEHYEARALLADMTIEEYIADHLHRTRDLTEPTAIHLSALESSAVRRMLRAHTGADIVAAIKRVVSWKVGGWSIELPESVQEQIHWYAKSSGKPIDDIAPQLILDSIRARFQA